jgi:hypothetical protein
MKKTMCLKKSSVLVFILLGLFGCGGESYHYRSERDIQAGPGLFSGDKEEIILFERKKSDETGSQPEEEKKPE